LPPARPRPMIHGEVEIFLFAEPAMRRMRRTLFNAALVATFTGCAAGSVQTGARIDRNAISSEQLKKTTLGSPYDVVQALHPSWLQPRNDSFTKSSQVWVYLDNTKLGDVTTLRGIPMQTIREIRYFDPVDAQNRWGTGHAAGVILVTTVTKSIQP
jgi:hypothetical protein